MVKGSEMTEYVYKLKNGKVISAYADERGNISITKEALEIMANGWNDGYQQGRADQKKEDNEFFNFESAWELEKQKIRADAIEEFKQALHTQFEQNKALAKRCSRGDRVKELALTNIDLEEVDNIAEQLKEQQ